MEEGVGIFLGILQIQGKPKEEDTKIIVNRVMWITAMYLKKSSWQTVGGSKPGFYRLLDIILRDWICHRDYSDALASCDAWLKSS